MRSRDSAQAGPGVAPEAAGRRLQLDLEDSSSATDIMTAGSVGLMIAYEMSTSRLTSDEDDREEEDPALQDRVVAVEDRLLQPAADAGPGEDRLGEHCARQQEAGLQADDRR